MRVLLLRVHRSYSRSRLHLRLLLAGGRAPSPTVAQVASTCEHDNGGIRILEFNPSPIRQQPPAFWQNGKKKYSFFLKAKSKRYWACFLARAWEASTPLRHPISAIPPNSRYPAPRSLPQPPPETPLIQLPSVRGEPWAVQAGR